MGNIETDRMLDPRFLDLGEGKSQVTRSPAPQELRVLGD
jgi:hypothetical protein